MQGRRYRLKKPQLLELPQSNQQPLWSNGREQRKEIALYPKTRLYNSFKRVEKTKWPVFISLRKGRDRLLCGQMHLKCCGDTKLLEKRADRCSLVPLSEDAAKNKSLSLR